MQAQQHCSGRSQMSGRMEQDIVTSKKGFVAYYRRRLLTPMEEINKVCLESFAGEVVKEILSSRRAYEYFRGYTHYQVLPRQWGHPSG
jgi:hypothetical protein